MDKEGIFQITEQRSRERFEYKYDVLCFKNTEEIEGKESKSPIRIHVIDISYLGLGVITSKSLTVGSYLLFNLNNRDENREMMLEVRWVKMKQGEHHAGLSFVALTKEDIMFLHEIILEIKKEHKKI